MQSRLLLSSWDFPTSLHFRPHFRPGSVRLPARLRQTSGQAPSDFRPGFARLFPVRRSGPSSRLNITSLCSPHDSCIFQHHHYSIIYSFIIEMLGFWNLALSFSSFFVSVLHLGAQCHLRISKSIIISLCHAISFSFSYWHTHTVRFSYQMCD